MFKVSKSERTLKGFINLPASKSISNRLLVLQFFHPSRIHVRNYSLSDDTVLLESLLLRVTRHKEERSPKILSLDVANSGTAMRFMTAVLSGTPGSYVLMGDNRMAHRPVRILIEALAELGADIQYLENPGYLPLYIKGKNLVSKDITVDASESSQHVSALMLVSSAFSGGMNIILKNEPVSRPYIDMTCKILEMCGFPTIWQEELIRLYPGKKVKVEMGVEPDWSSAAFWFAIMALAEEGEMFFHGLKRGGLQGDEVATELFSHLGVLATETDNGTMITKMDVEEGPFQWDFRNCPDLALPAIVCCAFLGKEAEFTGLEGLRIKESDRINSLEMELAKFNAGISHDYRGVWKIKPVKTRKKKVKIDSHSDHRVVMAMIMAAMKGFEIELDDPEVVNKSYPGFWRDMKSLGFETG